MRLIVLVIAVSACAAGNRTTRVLADTEYVAFGDRPSGGYAPMAPPDCTAGSSECAGQWLAQVHIGERGGAIERVLQTRSGFQIYVRAKQACDGDPEPNWQLLLRKPVVPINVVQLGKAPACDAPVTTSRR